MTGEAKRTYHSEAREAQAEKTRARILEAGKELFQSEGFDRVTISKLAKSAGVSTPTIYAIFKSKRGVLQALIDDALPPEKFTALIEEGIKEKSPVRRLHITAKLSRQIYDAERERMDLLRSASVVAPELKELEEERETRRYNRQAEYVKTMKEEGVLAKELSLSEARDLLWALTGRDLYRMFVIDRGWTSDQYEKRLARLLIQSLLNPSLATSSRSSGVK